MLIVVALAVAGAAVGIAWAMVAPAVQVVVTTVGPVPVTEEAAGDLAAMDSWYALLSGGVGVLLSAVLATIFLRHGVAMVLALVVGGCVAAVVALVVGGLLANGAVVLDWHPSQPPGAQLAAPLMLHARGYLLVWPIAVLAPVVPLAWFGWSDDEPQRGVHT